MISFREGVAEMTGDTHRAKTPGKQNETAIRGNLREKIGDEGGGVTVP